MDGSNGRASWSANSDRKVTPVQSPGRRKADTCMRFWTPVPCLPGPGELKTWRQQPATRDRRGIRLGFPFRAAWALACTFGRFFSISQGISASVAFAAVHRVVAPPQLWSWLSTGKSQVTSTRRLARTQRLPATCSNGWQLFRSATRYQGLQMCRSVQKQVRVRLSSTVRMQ
jgi:hypothetical protein